MFFTLLSFRDQMPKDLISVRYQTLLFDNKQYFTELPSAEIFAAAAVFGSSAGA